MLILEEISSVADRVASRPLAGIECCLALWAARAPEREPLAPAARQIQARMSPRAQELADELDRTLPGWPLRALNSFFRIGIASFADSLATLAEQPARQLALDLLLGSAPLERVEHPSSPVLEVELDNGVAKSASRCARRLIASPEQTVAKVMTVIREFWAAGFAEVWARERELLTSHSRRLVNRLQEGPAATLARLSPRGLHDPDGDRLVFVGGRRTSVVDCETLNLLDVVPSLWLRRRVVIAYAPDRIAICIGLPGTDPDEMPPRRIVALLSVLGDTRRFEILRLCMMRPHSTKELARQLKLTEAPVSRHLKQLERHGLLVAQRDGRYVLYAAVPEEVAAVSRHLRRLTASVCGAEIAAA